MEENRNEVVEMNNNEELSTNVEFDNDETGGSIAGAVLLVGGVIGLAVGATKLVKWGLNKAGIEVRSPIVRKNKKVVDVEATEVEEENKEKETENNEEENEE